MNYPPTIDQFIGLLKERERLNCLRDLMGYIKSGEADVVHLFQDDATNTFHITVGNKGTEHYFAESFREVIDKAIEAQKDKEI